MREIKFRALYDDMGGGWKYGMLIYEGIVPRIQVDGTMTFATCLKGTEGQYTGLKDKNGKEIYEGDIMISKASIWKDGDPLIKSQVVWEERLGRWVAEEIHPEYQEREWLGEAIKPHHETEVIGNIYQNPELLNSVQVDGVRGGKSHSR